MLPPNNLLGVFLAFTSAAVWGSADFTGGFATRKRSPFQVLFLSAISGLVLLIVAALIKGESFPIGREMLWASLAGVTGTVGIGSLYKALSIGESATVAPTSAVIGAGLPVAFGFLTQGLPDPLRLVGFALAFIGIWVVSQSSAARGGTSRQAFALACLAGLGFAGFMIFISQVKSEMVFTPLILSRFMVFLGSAFLLRVNKLPFPTLSGNWVSLLAGVLDAGGNIFFMLARQFTRLDTAVVISSLYPAATVILTGLILKERISVRGWMGVVLCLAAIILITI